MPRYALIALDPPSVTIETAATPAEALFLVTDEIGWDEVPYRADADFMVTTPPATFDVPDAYCYDAAMIAAAEQFPSLGYWRWRR